MEYEADGKKVHLVGIEIGKSWGVIEAMLETLDVRSDVRFSGKIPLIDTGTVDKKTRVSHVGVELFLAIAVVCVTVESTRRGRA